MAYLHDSVLDSALQNIITNTNILYICSAEPANFAAVAGVTLGSKSGPTIGPPVDGITNGRRIVISAISDGVVSTSGTATHWALVDTDNSVLLASASLDASLAITDAEPFLTASFDIELPDA